jgi:cytochrome c-type biogenesis protein CcmH/NrfG
MDGDDYAETGGGQMSSSRKGFNPIVLVMGLLLLSHPVCGQTAESTQAEVQADIQHALKALQSNDTETAIREFNAALKLDPGNVYARGNLGVIAYMQGRYAEAADDYQQVLKQQPDLWKVQAMLGLCENRLGRLESARTWLEQSFPHLEEPKLKTQAGLELASLDYQVGDLGKSAGVISTLWQLDPKNLDVLYSAYRTYSDLAGSALNAIALEAPDSARMHLMIAEHLINEGDRDGAIAQYRKVLQLAPQLPGAHLELGEALLEKSKTEQEREEAESAFKSELALNPANVEAECRLGDLYLTTMNLDAAYKSYSRALEVEPNSASAQLGMGRVLIRMGKNQEALDHLREAARLDPVDATSHYLLAQTYRRLGQTSDAASEMKLFEDLDNSKKKIHEVYQEMHQIVPGENGPSPAPQQ